MHCHVIRQGRNGPSLGKWGFLCGLIVTLSVAGCSKPKFPCSESLAQSAPAAASNPVLSSVPPPQAATVHEAKRVFAAHDCCNRLSHSEIYRVGALRARNRVITVFHLRNINPKTHDLIEHIAILDGPRLLGTYQVHATHERLRDGKIVFDCDWRERERKVNQCDKGVIDDIDLNLPELPQTRVIFDRTSYLSDSI
jgi:hypothetical protein